jgi:hypothetical protein
LKANLQNLKGADGNDDPALLGYFIMAAVTSREDPTHFGGSGNANNLVERLRATVRKTGPDAGLFGTASPTFDGAFRQGVALAALAGAGVARWRIEPSITWLVNQQCANALWTAYRSNVTTPCPAANPSTFAGPDTNSSAMAVQGLAAYGSFPKKAGVVASLRHVQTANGGYPFLATTGQPSDPSSTALVIQALLAEKADPGTAVTALARFQLNCTDPAADRGAYFFPPNRTPNVFATVQAVPAAALRTLPLAASTPALDVPVKQCSSTTSAPGSAVLTALTTSGTTTGAATTAAVLAGTAGPCPAKTGVTVSVDFTAFKLGVQTRCAPGAQATGLAALQHAGFVPTGTSRYGFAFICRINNRPTPTQQACVTTPPPTAYWAYYHALAGATTWTYSTMGASAYKPPLGSIDAWAFGNQAKPSKTPAQIRTGT